MTEMKPIPDPMLDHPAIAHDQPGSSQAPSGWRSLLTRLKAVDRLFAALVILPTVIAAFYFGIFASDVYVSESRFIVRSPSKPNLSPLGAVLGGGSLVGGSEESEAVTEFLSSRQGLAAINGDGYVTRAWGNPSIFWFDRFGGLGAETREDLFEYYLDKVSAEDSTTTMVTVLSVQAFDPQTAQTINRRLLETSEDLVNKLSDRARRDSIAFAEAEVVEARQQAQKAALALAAFRDREGVIDPELQASAGLQMISKLQDQLIASQTQLRQLQTYTPQASQIPFLQTQIRSLNREIAEQTRLLAGGSGSLSSASARYQELKLASTFAEKQLGITLSAYQEAQAEARRKQAYVERISEPSLPDDAAYPRPLRNILAAFVLALLTWGVVSMLLVGIREHKE